MCGIAGVFAPTGAIAVGPQVADAMCRAITHRGPDDQGIFSHASAHIGMRRLAIIDLHSGHQPIANEDGSLWIVFNGEIYNYRELRHTLQEAGHRFTTQTDTEVIVHAYEQWGEQAFARLRGMFAVALLDLRRQALVLARDRLGKKPLYHFQQADGSWAFASELKCFRALPGFQPRINPAAAQDFFALGYVPGPASIYEGVHKLPPAHVLTIQGERQTLTRYWTLDFGPKWTLPAEALEEQLMAELDEAVRVRLVSDVPFGAFLSGGTDSSVVAALMARHLKQPVKTFSIGFKEAAFNELPDARRVARAIGAEHHEFVVEADSVHMLDRLAWHFDEPFGDASAIPTYLVSRLASQQVKMVLSGDGGDELFAGYERYARFQTLQRMKKASGGLAGPALGLLASILPGARGRRLGRIAHRLRQPWPDNYLSGVALSTQDDLAELLDLPGVPPDPFARVRAPFQQALGGEALDAMLWGDISSYLLEDILVKVDRMTMAHSLEARSPLLDAQLLGFAARLPFDLKMREGQGKWLLKRVARRLLPPEVLDKPKQGFAIPLSDWLRGPLRERLHDTLSSRSFAERGLFRVPAVHRCLHQHLSGEFDHGERLWLLLNFETWARNFLDGGCRPGMTSEPEGQTCSSL